MTTRAQAISVLAANTVSFTVCFAVWLMYGVLVTFLVDRQVYAFTTTQLGWLIGIPVLSGSLLRLPAGMLADRFGGRPVMMGIMLVSGLAAHLVSFANGFWGFLLGGLGFGVAGASFAAGVAYTSVWFPPREQGTVLGIFGIGNAGAALTALVGPRLLRMLTHGGLELERWRVLPRLYALALVATMLVYWLATFPRKPDEGAARSLRQRLTPLGMLRVWRFGLYYFLLFGGFVALSQWLIPYYVNVYALSVVTAGVLASLFSLPSGLFRAVGGWLSDRVGARVVMYWVLGLSVVVLVLLFPPRVELQMPGQGLLAYRPGTVTEVTDSTVVVGAERYPLRHGLSTAELRIGIHHPDERHLFLPSTSFRQTPVVQVGDTVVKGQLLVRGVTQIYFQANRWVFTALVIVLGVLMGLGSGAVLKHITVYFPGRVGVVGGLVGMLGALGGFAFPILFGHLLDATGIWTTSWMLLAAVAIVCLVWMHVVIRRMMIAAVPVLMREVDQPHAG